MAIVCPYCDHRLNLKAAKPGRFRPQCPNCTRAFLLSVPVETGSECTVEAIPNDTQVRTPPRPIPADAVATQVNHLDNAEPEEPSIPPKTLIRGFSIERELGRGGMGTVYLATQLSLDRLIALKVMSKRWATDPVFVARFTREAFAAAQLSHPNIVQIHDIGEVDGARFFSMEYVRGQTLAELLKWKGKLDPETAVGYILQAARGLKHAHDRGMIHRDVKPDNLLLDSQGLVKVADLGLVKTSEFGVRNSEFGMQTRKPNAAASTIPNSEFRISNSEEFRNPNLTGAQIALGTPAYMSPEQCRDATTVDHRADIYSLGCTLYVLVTGRTPFEGNTAVELMSKHAYDPVVPPEQIVSRVPKAVSAVIQRMMAKNVADRYQSMSEVIRTLESWLGVHHTGTFSPHEEQIAKLEAAVQQFNTCAAATLRARLIGGFFVTIAIAALLLVFFGKLGWAFGVFGLAIQAILAYFIIDGITSGGHLFSRVRRFAAGLGWSDWAVSVAAVAMFGILLALLNSLWIWLGFGVLGIALAFALHYGLDGTIAKQRRVILDSCEKQLRRLRMNGLDEEELRHFVAKFSGRDWEEFFEALFGYEAKLAARIELLRGGIAGTRDKYAAWREPLIAWMERIESTRKDARERKLLLAVERANLLATGASAQAAEDRAKAAADAMVRAANEIRRVETARTGTAPANVRTLVRAAEQPNEFAFVSTSKPDPLGKIVALFVGPHIRAVAASLLIAACALWAHQNGLMPGELSSHQQQPALDANRVTQPLTIGGVPSPLLAWVDSFNVGLAGLLLLVSLFFRGNLMSVFVLLGAAVAILGHQFGIRTVEQFRAYHVSLILGCVIALVGFRFGTR